MEEARPTGEHRIIQLHPTRRCNLRCLHCYSDSGPERREELALPVVRAVLEDAAGEGFTVVGFSGGEPLLYGSLTEALEHAHACGLVTTVTSNGMLLTERRLKALAGRADLLAISLDGVPASHNLMRDHPRAFESMSKRLETVRRSEIPFGFIFTLTQHNVHELDWVVEFAREQGAGLLQVHPLENAGRARKRLPGRRPDEIESAFAQLQAIRLREQVGGDLMIQVDVADTCLMREAPERVFAGGEAEVGRSLGELISPLAVETDGTVVPLQYGFARRFALGNLHEASLRELAERWRRHGYNEFRGLCSNVFDELTDTSQPRFVNWYEVVGERAEVGPV